MIEMMRSLRGDSIDYPTSEGDNNANDDGDDLSEDDADDEDEDESSDNVEEKEEHLAPTVPALALYKVERLLAIPTPPLSPVSPTSYLLPPFLMPLPIFTPLHTSSFPLPLSIPSTSGSESIPEADIPLRKRSRFTTRTSRYEIGESFVAAARQIRPTLTIADKRRANDKLIGRLRRERQYFSPWLPLMHRRTLVTQIEALQRDVSTLQRQHIDDEDRLTRHIQDKHAQRDDAPEDGDKSVSNISNYIAENQVKFASCTLIGSALTWWNSHMRAVGQEVAYAMPWKTLKQMMTAKYCPRGEVKKLEVKLWNLKVKGTNITSYTLRFQELSLLCGRMFPEESDKIERYVGGLPEMIRGNVMSY
nr:reverse transcriptase domain-containing protein [Tanacetum cinerariifolium]